MARIAGVDLPRTKRVEIGLTYIYGIGRVRSNTILKDAGVSPDIRVKDLSEDDVLDEHQAVDGNRLLPRYAPPPEPAGARPAHPDERADAQGTAQGRDCQEEDDLIYG
jgi:hypothetical protein